MLSQIFIQRTPVLNVPKVSSLVVKVFCLPGTMVGVLDKCLVWESKYFISAIACVEDLQS